MALTPIKLFKGDASNELVETFSGFTDLQGGGSMPVSLGVYSAESLNIPSGGNTNPDWVFQSGDALLDLSVPNTPEVVSAGVYLVTVTGGGSLTTPGGTADLGVVSYDTPTFDNQLGAGKTTWPFSPVGQTYMQTTLPCHMPLTGVFQLAFQNNDGVAAVSLSASSIVVMKLSD